MPIGLNLSVPKMQQRKLHPAEELWGWLIIQIGIMHRDFEKSAYIEVKQKLHELYNRGYEDGREDEHAVSKKGGM